MSWSVSAIGRPDAVIGKMAYDFQNTPCIEPEETVRQAVGAAIKAALSAQDSNSVVKVVASGHQSQTYTDGKATGINNMLNVSIEPIHGFIE